MLGLCYLFFSHLNPKQIQAKKKNPSHCVLFCFVYFHKRLQTVLVSYLLKIVLSATRRYFALTHQHWQSRECVNVCVATANICAAFKIYETKCCSSTIYLLPHINSLSKQMFYSNFNPLEANISFVRGLEIETAEPYVREEQWEGSEQRRRRRRGGGRKVWSGGSICRLPDRLFLVF